MTTKYLRLRTMDPILELSHKQNFSTEKVTGLERCLRIERDGDTVRIETVSKPGVVIEYPWAKCSAAMLAPDAAVAKAPSSVAEQVARPVTVEAVLAMTGNAPPDVLPALLGGDVMPKRKPGRPAKNV